LKLRICEERKISQIIYLSLLFLPSKLKPGIGTQKQDFLIAVLFETIEQMGNIKQPNFWQTANDNYSAKSVFNSPTAENPTKQI